MNLPGPAPQRYRVSHCLDVKRLVSYYQSVNTVNGTVRPAGPGRRAVRRARPALDESIDVVLAEFDPALRPAIIAYADAKRAEYEARSALSTEMTRHGVRWRAVDAITGKLVYGTA